LNESALTLRYVHIIDGSPYLQTPLWVIRYTMQRTVLGTIPQHVAPVRDEPGALRRVIVAVVAGAAPDAAG